MIKGKEAQQLRPREIAGLTRSLCDLWVQVTYSIKQRVKEEVVFEHLLCIAHVPGTSFMLFMLFHLVLTLTPKESAFLSMSDI